MAAPLEGVLVLDLSWILSGPFCTMILGDLGAEVIKVERPGVGDGARGTGPFVDGDSAYFMSINRNKKSVTLNLGVPRGRELFLGLVKKADVVVENFTPGTMKRLGLDYEVLSGVNAALIYCAISGFGQTGPYADRPALDIIVQAMGGVMSITGEPGGPPVRPGTSMGDITAGLFAAIGICSALYERNRSGRGQMLDLSMLDSQVAVLENAFARYFATGEVPRALGTRHPAATPFQAFPTRDGWMVVAIFGGNPTHWPLFCAAIGRVELIDDPRFQTSWSRTQHVDILEPIIREAMRQRTTMEWLGELLPQGIPCGPVSSVDQVASDPQVLYRRMFVELPHKRLGTWRYVNTPIKHSRTPGGVRQQPPDLGEHTEEVLSRFLGLSPQEVEAMRREGVV
ncbi:MAG: CoA transferase [Chloroflexi bacterium]|nr:CoA transferase [Chloroflexota bacterium]